MYKIHRLTNILSWNVTKWGLFFNSTSCGSHTSSSSIAVLVKKKEEKKKKSSAEDMSLTFQHTLIYDSVKTLNRMKFITFLSVSVERVLSKNSSFIIFCPIKPKLFNHKRQPYIRIFKQLQNTNLFHEAIHGTELQLQYCSQLYYCNQKQLQSPNRHTNYGYHRRWQRSMP